jgi:predicted  nucleic acid-binding Zn-ribbon protein
MVRKERNRLSAKQSRDNKNAYVRELENHLHQAQERVVQLEQDLEAVSKKFDALQRQAADNPLFFFH